MKYKLQNTSTTTTIWVENPVAGNAFPFSPGEKVSVPETTKDLVLKNNPGIVTDLGPVTDEEAPAYYSAATAAAWTLVSLGPGNRYYSKFKIFSSAAGPKLSFSGWNSAAPDNETAPPTWSQIDIPTISATSTPLELEMEMNPTNKIYVLGNGTATVTIIAV